MDWVTKKEHLIQINTMINKPRLQFELNKAHIHVEINTSSEIYRVGLLDCECSDGDILTVCLIQLDNGMIKITDNGFISIRLSYGNGTKPDLSNSTIQNGSGEYYIIIANEDMIVGGIKEFIRVFRECWEENYEWKKNYELRISNYEKRLNYENWK